MNRWTPVLVTAAMLLAYSAGRAGGDDKRTDVVRTMSTERLEIVDSKGNNRILMTMIGDAPFMAFLGEDGLPQLTVDATGGGCALRAYEQGKLRLALGLNDGDAALALMNDKELARTIVSDVGVSIRDEQGRQRIAIAAAPAMTSMMIVDEDGKITWRAQ